jgi:UDP-N-acetylmuramoyl-L-alanyl-D-glutamate--2,6-diaminopimelate ligase
VVDYAHTPAGLEVVLKEARALATAGGRVLVAFGCGGNRDRAKRPAMGRAASLLSDVAVLTSDNPRDEDPLSIIEEVRAGVDVDASPQATFVVEADRGAAIALVLEQARAGDVVVIAGKGHEDYQEIGSRRLPFDDVVEARRTLSARFPADPSTWVAVPSAETNLERN